MSPKKAGNDSAPAGNGKSGGLRGMRPLGAAALATLTWSGILLMRLPDVVGFPGIRGFLVAAGLGLILGFTPLRQLLWIAAGLTTLLLLVVGYTPLIDGPARDWVRRDPEPLHPPDAIVVFSAWLSEDGHIDQEGMDRLLSGVALAERWRRPLVISTVRPEWRPGVSSALDQNRIIALAGDSLELYRTDSVHSTHDEALALARLSQAHTWHSIAVVTSPLHSRRACATVTKAGFTVICLPSESRDISFGTMGRPADRLPAFGEWIYERLGWIKYAWKGWL
jgi:uncharacterized SAM-binding protein YcdF (DUF218 family)